MECYRRSGYRKALADVRKEIEELRRSETFAKLAMLNPFELLARLDALEKEKPSHLAGDQLYHGPDRIG
jgi:hypothetical protein